MSGTISLPCWEFSHKSLLSIFHKGTIQIRCNISISEQYIKNTFIHQKIVRSFQRNQYIFKRQYVGCTFSSQRWERDRERGPGLVLFWHQVFRCLYILWHMFKFLLSMFIFFGTKFFIACRFYGMCLHFYHKVFQCQHITVWIEKGLILK